MADSASERFSLERCRALLGSEGRDLSDEEIAAVRDHADAMAQFLSELFLEQHSAPAKYDDAKH